MSHYGPGFLYTVNEYGSAVELINHARTAYGLQVAINAGDLPDFDYVLEDAGCPGLNYEPCLMASDGTVTTWPVADFSAAGAPWYNGGEASSEGIGFFIDEWTGLDGGHHHRTAIDLATPHGGARFGQQSSGHRVWAINVTIIGTTERGVNYLFRWLESTLLQCCSSCGSRSMWIREFCPPDTGDLTEGMARADKVVLLDGPTWIAPPVDDAGRYIRAATFTLGVGDPCLYRDEVDVTSADCLAASLVTSGTRLVADNNYYSGSALRVCATMPVPEFGRVSPIITITSPGPSGINSIPELSVSCWSDPRGVGCSRLSEAYLISRMFIQPGAGIDVEIDMGKRRIRTRDTYTDMVWGDGSYVLLSGYDAYAGTTRRWGSFDNCDTGLVVVEPAYSTGNAGGYRNWSVDINAAERFGCCG